MFAGGFGRTAYFGGKEGGNAMKGYSDKRRRAFVRIVAAVLAVMMAASVFSVLIFR